MNIPQASLNAMSMDTLLALNSAIVATIKSKRAAMAYQRGAQLRVGQKVSFFSSKKGRNIEGTVTEINRTRCVVKENYNGRDMLWTVPMNMIPAPNPALDKPTGTLPAF